VLTSDPIYQIRNTPPPAYKDPVHFPLVADINVTSNDTTTALPYDNIEAFILFAKGDKAITINAAQLTNENEMLLYGINETDDGKGYVEGEESIPPYVAVGFRRMWTNQEKQIGYDLVWYLKGSAGGNNDNNATKTRTPAIQNRNITLTDSMRLCDKQMVYHESYMADECTEDVIAAFFSKANLSRIIKSKAAGLVTGVAVTPETATVEPGGTQAFTAAGDGENSPSQDVNWAVFGSTNSATVISVDGNLTVAGGETAQTLAVVATSIADSDKTGMAVVTVSA
jgi:phi13 family phage major tail protein